MKSPWRFLADLTSRRKTQAAPLVPATLENPAEDQAGDQDLASALSAKTTKRTDHLLGTNVNEPSEATSHLPSEPAVNRPEVTIERPDPTPVAIAPATLGDVEALSSPGKNRSKRIKPGSVQVGTQTPLKPIDDPRVVSLPARPLTFLEEVAVLDEEIAALKADLALKLKLQNAQLKKMLERFDIR